MKTHTIQYALTSLLTVALTGIALGAGAENPPPKSAATAPAIPTVGVQELLKLPKQFAGRQVVLEGFVTEVCKRKGCWANIHDTDPNNNDQIRAKQDEGDGSFKAFLPEVQGKTVRVTGEVHATKIDPEYLDKWEARVKASQKTGGVKEKAGAIDSTSAALQQIAGFRKRVAESKEGFLTSVSFAAAKWEVIAE